MRVRLRGWRPIGASTRRARARRRRARARGTRARLRARRAARTSAVCAARVFATTMQAARVLVEAVHDAGARQRGGAGVVVQQGVEQRARAGCRCRDARPGRPACRSPAVRRPRTRSASGDVLGRNAWRARAGTQLDVDALAAAHAAARRRHGAPSTRTSPGVDPAAGGGCARARAAAAASAWSSRCRAQAAGDGERSRRTTPRPRRRPRRRSRGRSVGYNLARLTKDADDDDRNGEM